MEVVVEEKGREVRLNKIGNYLVHHGLDELITSISDHEGILSVVWNTKPRKKDMNIVNKLWYWVFDEPNVYHYFEGKLLIESFTDK